MQDAMERFWAKVDRSGGPEACWPWLGSKTKVGRPYTKRGGKNVAARRMAYELTHGVSFPDRPGKEGSFDATCGTTGCVNPAHIEPPGPDSYARRFWARVERRGPDECWPWKGSVDKFGYGHAALPRSGLMGLSGCGTRASRVAWVLTNGPLPDGDGYHGTCVCHSCDNPICVNPAHLWPGSMTDNMSDKVAKGRQPKGLVNSWCERVMANPLLVSGENSGAAKLTEAKVREIRSMAAGGLSNCEIGRRLAIPHQTVQSIVRRKTWKHVA